MSPQQFQGFLPQRKPISILASTVTVIISAIQVPEQVTIDGINKQALRLLSRRANTFFGMLSYHKVIRLPSDMPEVETLTLLMWMNNADQLKNYRLPYPCTENLEFNINLYTAAQILQMPYTVIFQLEVRLRRAFAARDLTKKEMEALERLFANKHAYTYEDGRHAGGFGWEPFHELVVTAFAERALNRQMSKEQDELLVHCETIWSQVLRVLEEKIAKYPKVEDLGPFEVEEIYPPRPVNKVMAWLEDNPLGGKP